MSYRMKHPQGGEANQLKGTYGTDNNTNIDASTIPNRFSDANGRAVTVNGIDGNPVEAGKVNEQDHVPTDAARNKLIQRQHELIEELTRIARLLNLSEAA